MPVMVLVVIETEGLSNLNIIELAMCVGVCVSHVLDSQLLNGWTYGHENCRVCSRTRSHDSVIFFVFFGLIFFKLRRI